MINIIGGTYREINLDSGTHEIFGSGLRASNFFLENNKAVEFFTYGNDKTTQHLEIYQNSYEGFTFNCLQSEDLITFKYSFALNNPIIYPNINLVTQLPPIKLDSENLVCFGMVESSFIINGEKVVYDPQTSINPKKFSNFGQTDELIYILNLTEAKSISGSDIINEIVDYFFIEEKSRGLIIKNGPYGATVYTPENISGQKIPSFITDNVFKIGSGDIFTAAFSYYWMTRNETIDQCALYASKCTAVYCNNQSMKILDFNFSSFDFKEFIGKNLSKKEVYLASPIFSLADIMLIDQIRDAFLGFGVKVFSPYHDIGYGDDVDIAIEDLKGLNKADIVFAVLDGLDSGTFVELGYSMAKDKPMIGYHRTCEDSSLLMLSPSKIKQFKDLTTSIYQTIWHL